MSELTKELLVRGLEQKFFCVTKDTEWDAQQTAKSAQEMAEEVGVRKQMKFGWYQDKFGWRVVVIKNTKVQAIAQLNAKPEMNWDVTGEEDV